MKTMMSFARTSSKAYPTSVGTHLSRDEGHELEGSVYGRPVRIPTRADGGVLILNVAGYTIEPIRRRP